MSALDQLFARALEIGGPDALNGPCAADAVLPAVWAVLWRTHDGQGEGLTGLFDGYVFLPLTGLVDSVEAERVALEHQGLEGWFPLAKDFAGAYLAIDPTGRCVEIGREGEPEVWATDPESLAERMLATDPPRARIDGVLDGVDEIRVTLPNPWPIGDAVPVGDGTTSLVRCGPETLDLLTCLVTPDVLVFRPEFEGPPRPVSVRLEGTGGLTSRGDGGLFWTATAVDTLAVTVDSKTVREPGPIVPNPALEAALEGRPVEVRADSTAEHRAIAAFAALRRGALELAEQLLDDPPQLGREAEIFKVLDADLAYARGDAREARRKLWRVDVRELVWMGSVQEPDVIVAFEDRYPDTPSEPLPLPLTDTEPKVAEDWVSPDHLRVHLTPQEARDGKAIIVGNGVGIRLPAGAGHGLGLKQELDGRQVRVEAWVESPHPDLSFDRWDATFRASPGAAVHGPYGPVDVSPPTREVAGEGLVRPNGERGTLFVDWDPT